MRDRTDNQEPTQDKPFAAITNKVVVVLKYKGARALDELVGPSNKGKIRLISRADEKKYKKGKRNGSLFRAERVNIIHEMAIEEARNTEVNITGTARGRYGNAHIRYDINDGLVDACHSGNSTNRRTKIREGHEQARAQKEKKDKRTLTKEEEHEIKEKYRPRSEEDA
jgi:hypothetical protein